MRKKFLVVGIIFLIFLIGGFISFGFLFRKESLPSTTQPSKSEERKVYLVSDEDWHSVFRVIPLAVYYEENETRKTPLLVYHKEGDKIDWLSIRLFLEKYNPKTLIFFEPPPDSLKEKLQGYEVKIENIDKIQKEKTVLCDPENYIVCMYATIYASFHNLGLNYFENLGRKIVVKKGNENVEIALAEIENEMRKKNENVFILTNPQDVLEPIKTSSWIESEGIEFFQKLYSEHSLIAPYYALCRNAVLIPIDFPIPLKVKKEGSKGWKKEKVSEFIKLAKEKMEKLKKNSDYSVILLGTPFYIPQTLYYSMYHQREIDSSYGEKVGRVMGYTISDVSAYVNRIFFLKPSSKKIVGILQTAMEYYQIRFMKRLKAHLENFLLFRSKKIFGIEGIVFFPTKILKDTRFLIYIGHGGTNGFANTFVIKDLKENEISLDGLVLMSSGCLVCDFADITVVGEGKEELFCLELLRRGALAQIVGVAGVSPGRSVQVTPYLIEGFTVGEALRKFKNQDPEEKSLVVIGDPEIKLNVNKKILLTDYKNFNPSKCEKLEVEYERDICFCEVAEKIKNSFLCEKIKDSEERDHCRSRVGREIKDLSVCEKITLQHEKDKCYFEIGIEKLDPSICEKIENITLNGDCFSSIVQKTHQVKICDKAKTQRERDVCRYQVVLYTHDDSLCKLMETREYKNNCYLTLAYTLVKPELCKKADDGYYRDRCYLNIAIVTKDTSYCEKIKDKEMKKECFSY
jgi:hypothetical protein